MPFHFFMVKQKGFYVCLFRFFWWARKGYIYIRLNIYIYIYIYIC